MWEVLVHSPVFGVRNAAAVLRHVFRGSNLRSILGLENERTTFARYRRIRRAEREYV